MVFIIIFFISDKFFFFKIDKVYDNLFKENNLSINQILNEVKTKFHHNKKKYHPKTSAQIKKSLIIDYIQISIFSQQSTNR